MSRKSRIVRNIAIGLVSLLALLLFATVLIIPTDWFRNYVREKIVSATEQGTGGRVELASFSFDEWKLQAVVTGFVIHGKEPPGAPPFVRVARAQVNIRLFTSLGRLLDITGLRVDRPEVNVMTLADGSTNIPTPREKSTSNQTVLENVVDLAVGHFELTNGLLSLDARRQALNIKGSNLRAQLAWNTLTRGYQGEVAIEPVYVVSGRSTPVRVQLTLPVSIQRDRIDFRNASVSTPASKVLIDGFVANMRDPKVSAHLNGYVATADLANIAGLAPLPSSAGPTRIDLDANATVASDAIQVTGLRATFGGSALEASGTLKDPHGNGSLAFRTELALGELGRLFRVGAKPDGVVDVNGNASLDAGNNYRVTGNIEAKRVSFLQGARRISNINLASALQADPHVLRLNGLRLSAFGAELFANASLEDFRRYSFEGKLRGLDIQRALREFGMSIPYDGLLSGSIGASGDTAAPGTKGITAQARLAIAPGRRGMPLTGRINANYNGAADSVTLADSSLVLPHTRLTLNGSLNRQLNVALTSRDLNDLTSAISPDKPPVNIALASELRLNGVVSGSLTAPRFEGHLAAGRFSVEGRQFDSLAADVGVSDSNAAVRNGSLTRSAMLTQFAGAVGLRHWKALPQGPVSADLSVRNGDLADAVVLAGGKPTGYSGTLNASAHVQGTVGDPQGKIEVESAAGTLNGVAFDRAQVQVLLTEQRATIPSAFIQSGNARADLTGEFQHPRDSFTTGHLQARLRTNQVDLAQLRMTGQKPNAAGTVRLTADVSGELAETAATPNNPNAKSGTEFLLTSVNADVAARGFTYQGQHYGDLTGSAQTSGQTVKYTADSNFAGSAVHLSGNTQLARDYPTTADANIANLAIERVLAVAKQPEIRARGILSGTARFTGTIANPQGSADLSLARAVVYDEPLDRVHARVTYAARTVDVPQLEILAGPSRIDLTARYDHPQGNISQGTAQFTMKSNRLDLARLRTVQALRPGLGGALQLNASGVASVSEKEPRLQFSRLDANVEADGISAQGRNFGDIRLTASTGQGGRVNFALESNLAAASIRGQGNAQLSGDFPFSGQLSFTNVTYSHLRDLLGPASGQPAGFEGAADGEIELQGPAKKVDQLHGAFRITRLALTAPPGTRAAPIAITNQGPIAATIDRGVIQIQSAHLVGPQTDLQVRGSASLPAQTLNLTASASVDLEILPAFNRDIYSSGKIAVAATVGGPLSQPRINGQLTLRNATLNYTGLPNGISNANGVISFNGNNATIAGLTAESGGGKVTLTGFVGYGDVVRFGLAAKAAGVRVRVQQGVSVVAGADLRLDGTSQNSILSGNVTIQQLNYAPQSDFGSILSTASTPVQAPSAPSPVLDNMRLNIRVRTTAGLAVQASLAENLQASADLTVRGTASHPGVLGRVTVSQGQLVF
ncbi:MAG: translocation/assembly module TamB domain-containing protein, partial [Acidobacteriota bacterium]